MARSDSIRFFVFCCHRKEFCPMPSGGVSGLRCRAAGRSCGAATRIPVWRNAGNDRLGKYRLGRSRTGRSPFEPELFQIRHEA